MTRFAKLFLCWNGLAAALFLLFPALPSCSVLEDREPCPCFLTVDYTVVKADRPVSPVTGLYECRIYQPQVVYDVAATPDQAPDVDEVTVPKALSKVVAVFHNRGGVRRMLEGGTVQTWERGNEMDSVYAFFSDLDCTGEEASVVLKDHKQFSTLSFDDGQGGEELRLYNLVVRGTTSGFDAYGFDAVEGEYLADVQEYGDGRHRVRVPRQNRGDLALELWTKDSKLLVFSCPVGAYMFAMGYDVTAEDLPDYDIRIDFRQALLYVRVADWEDEQVFALYK